MSWTYLGIPYAGTISMPLYVFRIPAGIPSPETDHAERQISLDEQFQIRAPHVYLARADPATLRARFRIRVSIRTGIFNLNELQHAQGALIELPYPTNDTLLLTRAATEVVGQLFRPGCRYSKAEILLLDLRQPGEYTGDLFAQEQPVASQSLMAALDSMNERYGRGTVCSVQVPLSPVWGVRRDFLSQSYTTRLDQLWKISCK